MCINYLKSTVIRSGTTLQQELQPVEKNSVLFNKYRLSLAGRLSNKFMLKGVRKPTVGHLRQDLLSDKFDLEQIQLKIVVNQNNRIVEDSGEM